MEINETPCGVLALHKSAGMTSHDAVNRIRRLYGTRQVGHTGTLDPDAIGLLVILIGRAAKFAEYLTADDKAYTALLRLGMTSDTGDLSGNVVMTDCERLPTDAEIAATCESFVGRITQVPPMYSALKVNGRKLVDLARKGITVEREGREVTIHSLNARRLNATDIELDVECSKGTYIRTLCEDIGRSLGCGGLMASLKRTRSGSFRLEGAPTLDELEAMDIATRCERLVGVEELFADCPEVRLPPFFAGLAHNGCEIYLDKLGASVVAEIGVDVVAGSKTAENPRFIDSASTIVPQSARLVRLYDSEGFFALAEPRDFDGRMAIKPVKQYRV